MAFSPVGSCAAASEHSKGNGLETHLFVAQHRFPPHAAVLPAAVAPAAAPQGSAAVPPRRADTCCGWRGIVGVAFPAWTASGSRLARRHAATHGRATGAHHTWDIPVSDTLCPNEWVQSGLVSAPCGQSRPVPMGARSCQQNSPGGGTGTPLPSSKPPPLLPMMRARARRYSCSLS